MKKDFKNYALKLFKKTKEQQTEIKKLHEKIKKYENDLSTERLKRAETILEYLGLLKKVKEQKNKINSLEDYTKWLLRL